MTILLPSRPGPQRMTPRLISGRSDSRPAFGSGVQRVSRMGSRYAIEFVMPPMTWADAADWSDIDVEAGTVAMIIPQPGVYVGAPGVSLVDASGQTGSTLAIKGLTPYHVLRKNQWLSLITGGQRFCYRVKTETVADATGDAAVPLQTLLRYPHLNNDVVEIAEPRIEGFCTVAPDAWAMGPDGLVQPSFTIEESE